MKEFEIYGEANIFSLEILQIPRDSAVHTKYENGTQKDNQTKSKSPTDKDVTDLKRGKGAQGLNGEVGYRSANASEKMLMKI